MLALLALFCWLLGSRLLLPSSEFIATIALPVAIASGGAVLAGVAIRAPIMQTSRGVVSLAKSGFALIGILAFVVVSYNRGGFLVHKLCEYFTISSVMAYVILVIKRDGGSNTPLRKIQNSHAEKRNPLE
jgi:hypothetical protein